MNKNIIIALGGGLIIAVLVAFLVQMTLGGKQEQVVVAPPQKTEILVASKDLRMGAELGADDMRWQEWPKNAVFPGAIKREDGQAAAKALEGRLARNIAIGEPLVKTALLAQAKGNLVAANLKPGQRAIGINVGASALAGGFIGPGDYVDILLIYRESIQTDSDSPAVDLMLQKNLDKLALETILQNVKVLAIDQTATRAEDGKIKVGRTATLAVSIRDAEKLALAQEVGDLTLSLRGVGDDEHFVQDWPTISDARLTKIDDELFSEYEKMQKDSGIQSDIVRIYTGGSVSSVSVQ